LNEQQKETSGVKFIMSANIKYKKKRGYTHEQMKFFFLRSFFFEKK